MPVVLTESLSELYEKDEVAWLEAMAEIAAQRRCADLDLIHLNEFLSDMAKRDRREVKSRLAILLAHMLKWEHQPEKRAGSWRSTIRTQRNELRDQLQESGTLRNHAETVLERTYQDALKLAADETELPLSAFPAECPWTIDELINDV